MIDLDFHSVTLDVEKCKGCTTCIKHCPTEAIRVRNGKAYIIKERCIDCGQCIKVCPHRAKNAIYDSLDRLKEFKYNVAMPAPSLYGQFHNLDDISYVLSGLLKIGFDDVFEVACAAEIISEHTRKLGESETVKKPLISSACPACVRLIKKRFPDLVENVIPYAAPVELAARLARISAAEKTGFLPEEIGVFFISPCAAKVTAARNPVGLEKPVMDGALAMNDVYKELLPAMNKITEPELSATTGLIGVGWAVSGGESASLLKDSYLAVDGIENVIRILEDIEDDKLPDVEFIEINACTQGCVGGCLTVENPYAAKTRVRHLMKYLPVSMNKSDKINDLNAKIAWEHELSYTPIWQLDTDVSQAFAKLQEIKKFEETLPGIDCGCCGAPSCKAFAEDVILRFSKEDDCIFRMKERVIYMTGNSDPDQYLPPPFRKSKDTKE